MSWGRPLTPEELQRKSSAYRSSLGAQTTMRDMPATRMREGMWQNQQLDTPYGQASASTFRRYTPADMQPRQPYSWAGAAPATEPHAMPADVQSPSQSQSRSGFDLKPGLAYASSLMGGGTGNSAQRAMQARPQAYQPAQQFQPPRIDADGFTPGLTNHLGVPLTKSNYRQGLRAEGLRPRIGGPAAPDPRAPRLPDIWRNQQPKWTLW